MTSLCGHIPVIALLLTHGADVNPINRDGFTPLHLAAYWGQELTIPMLLENGADINLAGNKGEKPIDLAKTEKIKNMLIAHTTKKQQQQPEGQKQQPDQATDSKVMDEAQWFQAAKEGNLSLIQQGISDQININCEDNTGYTALWWATQQNHLPLVEYLLALRPELKSTDVSANIIF